MSCESMHILLCVCLNQGMIRGLALGGGKEEKGKGAKEEEEVAPRPDFCLPCFSLRKNATISIYSVGVLIFVFIRLY